MQIRQSHDPRNRAIVAHRKTEGGQALLMLTFALFVLFGMLGLVVDLGWANFRQQSAQASADAAALSAAQAAKTISTSPSCATSGIWCSEAPTACAAAPTNTDTYGIACLYASQNGFSTANGSRQNVTIAADVLTSVPTVPGLLAANMNYWITVRTYENIPQLFSAVLGNSSAGISARATAAVIPVGLPDCVVTLDNTNQKASLSLTGGAVVNAPCGIAVDSTNSDALDIKGNGSYLLATGSTIQVAGGDGGANVCSGTPPVNSPCLGPAPILNASSVTDPLSYVSPPPYSPTCTQTNYRINSGSVNVPAGTYCGGITVGSGATATFSGTVTLLGGGLSANSGATLNSGPSGVTFYNTFDGSHSAGPITINGGATTNLVAPTSGSMENILFFENRSLAANTLTETINGSSSVVLTGIMYFPESTVKFTGSMGATTPAKIAVISWDTTFSGGATFQDGIANGAMQGPPKVVLVE